MNGLKSKGDNTRDIFRHYFTQLKTKIEKHPVIKHYISVYEREHSQSTKQTSSNVNSIPSVKVTKNHHSGHSQVKSAHRFSLKSKINQSAVDILPSYIEVKEKDTLIISNSQNKINVGSRIASKGEGTVYDMDKANVLKVFHENKFTSHKMMKIYLLIQYAQPSASIAYPKEFLKDKRNKLVGYYMPRAKGIPLQAFFDPNSLKKHYPSWSLSKMLRLALNVTFTVKEVHLQNLIIGDLNANNILVENENDITIIDTDSFQIEDYPSDVGMVEYTRDVHLNNIINNGYANFLKSKFDDIFSLSVIIFQLLHTGQLPYNHKNGKDTYLDNIKKGYFPYSNVNQELADTPNGSKHQWKMTPQPLKDYFCLIFRDKQVLNINTLQKAIEDSITYIHK